MPLAGNQARCCGLAKKAMARLPVQMIGREKNSRVTRPQEVSNDLPRHHWLPPKLFCQCALTTAEDDQLRGQVGDLLLDGVDEI